jgi:hypothetical protein
MDSGQYDLARHGRPMTDVAIARVRQAVEPGVHHEPEGLSDRIAWLVAQRLGVGIALFNAQRQVRRVIDDEGRSETLVPAP